MTILILTSSYPSHPNDVSSTAGLFIRDFARALVKLDQNVIVSVAARNEAYESEPGIHVIPIPWKGGTGELASYPFSSPSSWPVLFDFFQAGSTITKSIVREYTVDRVLCMWIVPAGYFGRAANRAYHTPFDVWALGSDVWRIQKLPFGKTVLRWILRGARYIFADGPEFARTVGQIAHRSCEFLPSSRVLPPSEAHAGYPRREGRMHFLFVGRYHPNKGPDLLVKAIALLPASIRQRVSFDFFGYGVLREDLQRVILEQDLADCVTVHGAIDAQELSNRMAVTDYLFIPSRIESIPVVLSDAVQRGVPVVVTNVGDMGEMVRRHGAGIVVDHADVPAMRQGILKALEISPEVFFPGVAALAREFDISSVAKRWLGLHDATGQSDGEDS